uniref:Receptor-like serine/threonine-protein kinase n=1 Tax=Populus davidiana TaxID=266767 RepID=A0A6M2F9D9_9ROSI
MNDSRAQLMDDGNLVLGGSENGNSLWQSFQEPSDTYIPQMRLAANPKTGKKTLLTSWKSPSDPSIGSFSLGIDPSSIPEMVVWNDSRPIWRSGPWNSQVFIGVPEMTSVYLDGFNLGDDGNGGFTLSVVFADESYITNFVLSSEGKFGQVYWDDTNKGSWSYQWESVKDECDVYGKCGSFASCDAKNSPICSCLKGFEPKNADEWNSRNWTNGCVRRKAMQCERIQNGGELGKEDGFLKLERVKVPDFAEWSSSITEQKCRDDCWNNCSCVAYAYYTGIYCMLWKGNLTDIKMFSSGGADLYIRLAYAELDNKKINLKVIISLTVVVGAIAIAICVFYSWRWIERKRTSKKVLLPKRKDPILSDENVIQDNLNHVKLQDLPLFSLQMLIAATDNFNTANKLGQGGFGPVYKGKFPNGQEIALKRLSRASGQGQEEFTTEVVVISKLQHMNLVRLLGCCVEGEEMMLVYEYMPNRSLDAFLFDPSRKHLLDWKKRFNIVEGICRGLLYLHRDSRLRIIHRDLKASNILLDQELNPKISDFGMARIFRRNEDQADTGRVVGTFGYMSPEYAMEGRFSEKSDVFSFGVLLLEIISGRKNTSFYGNEEALSLLGYAWKLWNEGNIAALVDPGISYPSFREEIFRCVHVGLLCVQEFAKDRPAIFTIISMLNSEIVDLPTPKQPAFSERRSEQDTASLQHDQRPESVNNVTVTLLSGR